MALTGQFERRECSKCCKTRKDIFVKKRDAFYCRKCYDTFLKSKKSRSKSIETQKEEGFCSNEACKKLVDQNNSKPHQSGRICLFCYVFHKRHGRNPIMEEVKKQRLQKSKPSDVCSNTACGVLLYGFATGLHPVTGKRLCKTCYPYTKRTGKDRTKDVIKKREHFVNLNVERRCSNSACNVALNTGRSGRHPVTGELLCAACGQYVRRTGKDRTVDVTKKWNMSVDTRCSNPVCGAEIIGHRLNLNRVTMKRLCSKCYDYYRRTGEVRTAHQVKNGRRKVDKDIELRCCIAKCSASITMRNSRPVGDDPEKRRCSACQIYFERNGGKERFWDRDAEICQFCEKAVMEIMKHPDDEECLICRICFKACPKKLEKNTAEKPADESRLEKYKKSEELEESDEDSDAIKYDDTSEDSEDSSSEDSNSDDDLAYLRP